MVKKQPHETQRKEIGTSARHLTESCLGSALVVLGRRRDPAGSPTEDAARPVRLGQPTRDVLLSQTKKSKSQPLRKCQYFTQPNYGPTAQNVLHNGTLTTVIPFVGQRPMMRIIFDISNDHVHAVTSTDRPIAVKRHTAGNINKKPFTSS